jgi:hypothetical protein
VGRKTLQFAQLVIGSTYPKTNIWTILTHTATRMLFHARFRTSYCGSPDPLFTHLGIPDGQMLTLLPPEGVFRCYRDCGISSTSRHEIQLKSEVYIHLSQLHLNSFFHNSWHLIVIKIPVLGQLGSPLVRIIVTEWFISAFISFIPFPVGQKFTYTQLVFGSIAFKLFQLGQMFQVAFHKLPTISWVNFGSFLLIEVA